MPSLVGSEMCIRDRGKSRKARRTPKGIDIQGWAFNTVPNLAPEAEPSPCNGPSPQRWPMEVQRGQILMGTGFCFKASCRRSCTKTVLDSQGIRGIKAAMKGEKRGTACKSSSEVRMAMPFPDAAVEKPDKPRRGLRLPLCLMDSRLLLRRKARRTPKGIATLFPFRTRHKVCRGRKAR